MHGSVHAVTMKIADMGAPLIQGPSRGTAGEFRVFLYAQGHGSAAGAPSEATAVIANN